MSIPNFTDRTAPRAPFKPGSVPGAAWFNIETVFCHACPNPGAMLRSHGLHVEEGTDPSSPGGYAEASLWAACVEAGLDREVATPETLAALADTFRAVDAEGRGVLLTVDHAGVGERPDTRAAGWIKALHAEGGKLVMLDKNGTRPYTWQEIGEIIASPVPDGVPNLQAEVARLMINDSSQINNSKPDDPRREVLIALRDRIIPTVSDGRDPKMTIHRALLFSDAQKFKGVLQKLLAVDANDESWYFAKPGFLVDSWNNNRETIQNYSNKRYIIILHMVKYKSRRIDGLYKHILTDKQIALGIDTEGESWMPGHIRLRLVSRNPKVTTTDDGKVTYEFWVEEP